MQLLSDNPLWVLIIILLIVLADLLAVYLKLRRKHDALTDEYAQRNLLLNSVAEGVYGLDLNGNCTFCNAATLKLLGYREESELVGRNLHNLIHHTHADGSPYDAADCKACLAYKQYREIHLEDEILWRADGTSFPVEYWSYPVYKGKKLVGAVVSFVDITERKETEARLKEANRELDAFVYTVSHDLRTPLSAIIGYTDFIKENHRPELSEDLVALLDTIERQGARMAAFVEDLLALSTVGNLAPPDTPLNSADEVAFVLSELKGELAACRLEVVVGDLPEAKIPQSLLGQIFQNLIGNALHYAGQEGGPIEIGGDRVGPQVRFYVRDHGQGIPEAERTRIFELFYRGSTGKSLPGSGVGLATVQKIARLYGGDAWVEETPGGGATFWVKLEA